MVGFPQPRVHRNLSALRTCRTHNEYPCARPRAPRHSFLEHRRHWSIPRLVWPFAIKTRAALAKIDVLVAVRKKTHDPHFLSDLSLGNSVRMSPCVWPHI